MRTKATPHRRKLLERAVRVAIRQLGRARNVASVGPWSDEDVSGVERALSDAVEAVAREMRSTQPVTFGFEPEAWVACKWGCGASLPRSELRDGACGECAGSRQP